jgi:hypothetical protein
MDTDRTQFTSKTRLEEGADVSGQWTAVSFPVRLFRPASGAHATAAGRSPLWVGHAHHLPGDAVRLPLVSLTGCTDPRCGLAAVGCFTLQRYSAQVMREAGRMQAMLDRIRCVGVDMEKPLYGPGSDRSLYTGECFGFAVLPGMRPTSFSRPGGYGLIGCVRLLYECTHSQCPQ